MPRRDRVLYLMERGAIRQALGNLDGSTKDFIDAHDLLVELETYSVSRGAGSLVVNDNIRQFVGAPFERTLLHAMTAHNHLTRGHWDHAAIEARRIIQSLDPEFRGNFPEEPYSRFVAGLAFELIDDPSNAALQYRLANEALPHVTIDPDTGRISYAEPPEDEALHGAWPVQPAEPPRNVPAGTQELVVLFQTGRSPRRGALMSVIPNHRAPVYAEIHAGGRYLGRTHTLSDTAFLRLETERARALREAARTVTRIAVKEGIAVAVESNSEWAGDLVRLILIGLLEQPDERTWETLPRWMQAGRVAVPEGLSSYTLVLKDRAGKTLRSIEVDQALQRRRNLWVSVVRDVQSAPYVYGW